MSKCQEINYADRALRSLGLKPSKNRQFYFEGSNPHEHSWHRWDAIACNHDGSIVLVEVEGCKDVSNLHVEGHLTRAAMLVSEGMNIRELVWVININLLSKFMRVVSVWVRTFSRMCPEILFPKIRYVSLGGRILQSP